MTRLVRDFFKKTYSFFLFINFKGKSKSFILTVALAILGIKARNLLEYFDFKFISEFFLVLFTIVFLECVNLEQERRLFLANYFKEELRIPAVELTIVGIFVHF